VAPLFTARNRAAAPVTVCSSPSAAARLAAMEAWIGARPSPVDVLVVAPTRGAADDFAGAVSARRGATFGLARASLRELVVKLALPSLARRDETPASALALEALATRVAAEADAAGALTYLGSMIPRPGFRRTLLATLSDLRLSDIPLDALASASRTGADLRALAVRFTEALADARVADYPALLSLATAAIDASPTIDRHAVILLDVPIHAPRERAFVAALAARARALAATVPAGDDDTHAAYASLPGVEWVTPAMSDASLPLARVQRELFQDVTTGTPSGGSDTAHAVQFFSAPGEGREAIEIARRILQEAAAGRAFDEIAIAVRAPALYAAHLESALHRSGIPAWFARGTSRPDPAGRAFLALLTCAAEGLSAGRFAEYVSLHQVPRPQDRATRPGWSPPDDDAMRSISSGDDAPARETAAPDDEPPAAATGSRAFTAPWRWESLLNEAAVIGGLDRWTRRLSGLEQELRLQAETLGGDDPDAPRARAVARDRAALAGLRSFALPVIATLSEWPREDHWGGWLERFDALAPRVLATPQRVLSALGDLRAMSGLGPVGIEEVRDVLHDRLADLHVAPPVHRHGRVFVGTPDALRGRAFEVVFIAGLAERVFPQRVRPDPLLLDDARAALRTAGAAPGPRLLPLGTDRAHDERLRLRIAAGAASSRLYVSFPSMEVSSARPRVPSFYALDLHRALTGRLPDHDGLVEHAAAAAGARLAWPAPSDPAVAIDTAEHDLSTLRRWLLEPSRDLARGRARYLLELSPTLSRSLRMRFFRSRPRWTPYDGLAGEPHVRAALSRCRLQARPCSPSSLQRFAACPYQFYLASILRLAPREEARAMHRIDPMTRGRIVHDIVARCTRELIARHLWPTNVDRLPDALAVLAETVAQVDQRYRDDLAPPIDAVWRDEMTAIDADVRGWLHEVASAGGRWIPMLMEFGIGFGPEDGARDPASVPAPATLAGGWKVHGVVDAVEHDPATGALRVTDYKTGADVARGAFVVGGGSLLQPALYGLAVEAALDRTVEHSRLFYCTAKGRYASRPLVLSPDTAGARRTAVEVLEIVDRAIDLGFLPPAPRHEACVRCEFRVVCGPLEERRLRDKDPEPLADLRALRNLK
jgi:RecB family exonuclease